MTTPVDVALTQLGVVEETGHNDGVPADRYMRGDKLSWCAGFVMWCYDESDWAPLYRSSKEYYLMRNVQSMEDRMKERGCWFGHRMVDVIEPSDIVFYGDRAGSDRGQGRHVGLAISGVGGLPVVSFETIEGNYGDSVKKRVISVIDSKVTGFARPRVAV